MRVVFKESNVVVHVRKNSSLGKDVIKANGNESEIAKLILDDMDAKMSVVGRARNVFNNIMVFGLLFTWTKAVGHYDSNVINAVTPFIYGVTGLCAAAGLATQGAIIANNKKYYKILDVYKITMNSEDKSVKGKNKN